MISTNTSTDGIPLSELANSLFAEVLAERYENDGHLIFPDKLILEYDNSAQTIIFCGVPLDNIDVSPDVIESISIFFEMLHRLKNTISMTNISKSLNLCLRSPEDSRHYSHICPKISSIL